PSAAAPRGRFAGAHGGSVRTFAWGDRRKWRNRVTRAVVRAEQGGQGCQPFGVWDWPPCPPPFSSSEGFFESGHYSDRPLTFDAPKSPDILNRVLVATRALARGGPSLGRVGRAAERRSPTT